MSSSRLHAFAELGGYDRSGITWEWDDARASKDFHWPLENAEALAERVSPASLRSRLGLCVALFEIVAARMQELERDPYPLQVVESAWVSLADRRYLEFDERARSEWLGPVRGPLWCGFTWLTPALHDPEDAAGECETAFVYLVRLARHVVPDAVHPALDAWLDASIERIVKSHPAPKVGPMEDLFGRWAEWRRGPYVTAAAFDPSLPYDPADEPGRLERILNELDVAANPLLKPADALRSEGLADPYRVLPPYASLRR